MGTCFGKCSCSCCDCLLLKIQPSRLLVHRTAPKDQTFVMKDQRSTIEFENLMYDYDFQQPCSSRLRLRPSVSSWFKFDGTEEKVTTITIPKVKEIRRLELQSIQDETSSITLKKELPIIDPLLYHVRNMNEIKNQASTNINNNNNNSNNTNNNNTNNIIIINHNNNSNDPDNESGDSIVWDRESANSDAINCANELEWDDYQDDLICTEESDSLIREIERALQEK